MLAYLKRGEDHQRRVDTPEMLSSALRDLRTAAALDPGSTRTLERLGDVNFQLRRYANAAESYEGYIRLDDHSPEIFYKLALAARGDGRLARATTALQQAVKLNPTFHEAHYARTLPEIAAAFGGSARRSIAPSPSRPRSSRHAKSSPIRTGWRIATGVKSNSSRRCLRWIRPKPSA
jgi:tetratricopeptide (TPR) repeat protein